MATLGFRIGVDASKFCTNIKRCFYIYVDLLRDRTIQDVENRIKFILGINTSVWLLNGSFYLPPSENVRLLCLGDVLKVVEQKEEDVVLNENLIEVNYSSEQIIPKEKKNKKKKQLQDGLENDSNSKNIENHCETVSKTAEKENSIPSSLCRDDDIMICNGTESHVYQYSGSLKIDNNYSKDMLEVSNVSCSSLKSMEEAVREENAEVAGLCDDVEHPKKRRRTRVRKHKKKQTPSVEHNYVPPSTFKKKVYTPAADLNRTHIRFDDSDDDKADEPCRSNSTLTDDVAVVWDSSITETKSIFGHSPATKWDVTASSKNVTTNAIASGVMSNGTSDSGAFAKLLSYGKSSKPPVFERKRSECKAVSPQLPQVESENTDNWDISKYPKLPTLPKKGDLIAFKMLKIDQDYTPKISGYIMAKVLSACDTSYQLSLLVLGGGDEIKRPKGKFDLEEVVDNESNNCLSLNWNELYEPRLLYP